jgi:hypothetical protein
MSSVSVTKVYTLTLKTLVLLSTNILRRYTFFDLIIPPVKVYTCTQQRYIKILMYKSPLLELHVL